MTFTSRDRRIGNPYSLASLTHRFIGKTDEVSPETKTFPSKHNLPIFNQPYITAQDIHAVHLEAIHTQKLPYMVT